MIWTRPELRVLFVCTANICRSPLAEGLLRHRLRMDGLAARVQVHSAGTAAMRGLRPDPRVIQMAAEQGVRLGRIRSRRLTTKILSRSDYVLVMDRSQLEEIREMDWNPPNDAVSGDVMLLGQFLPASEREASVPDVPDPYFGDPQAFRAVHAMIDMALTGFMQLIQSRLANDSRHL